MARANSQRRALRAGRGEKRILSSRYGEEIPSGMLARTGWIVGAGRMEVKKTPAGNLAHDDTAAEAHINGG
jgi:hypothetical protein